MFGQRFNLAGGLVGTSFLVDSGGTVSSQSDAIGLPTGGFALAYLDNNFGELDITLSTWDASANLLDFVTANGPGGFVGGGDGNQTEPSLDVLSNGFIQVSWTNDFGVDFLDTVDTAVWSGPVPLSLILNAPGVALSSQNQSALAGLPLGKFSLAGHDTGGTSDITEVIQELVRTTTGDNTAEILSGDSLRDIMFGRGGDDFLFGGENNDSLFGEAGIDTLVGGPGGDRLEGGADRDRLEGGDGNDGLLGDDGDDQIVGEAGNDQMIGGAGFDLMLGGTGDDRLEGNDGNDRLEGEDGFDTLVGDEGIDLLLGGAGNDQMFGGNGGDRLEGAGGIDALAGGEGDDQMTGGTEGDFLFGGNGLDQLLGDEGADLLSGEGGGDRLQGGDGADQMYGGDGDDIMIGDAGNDDMNGQFGNDLFFFSGAFGTDTIYGFGAGAGTEDKIQFSGSGFTSFASILAATTTGASGAVITVSPGNTVTLFGVSVASLSAEDFLI